MAPNNDRRYWRRCNQCNKWFLTSSKKAKYCSESCKEKRYAYIFKVVGKNYVKAFNNSIVKTCDNSHVEAFNNSTVTAWDNSNVKAYDNSIIKERRF